MIKRKKATEKKTEQAPKTGAAFPAPPRRPYGAMVFVKRVTSEAEAAALVRDHGFRVIEKSAAGYRLQADAIAYRSYKGE